MQKVASLPLPQTSIEILGFNGFLNNKQTDNNVRAHDATLESIKLLAYAILERAFLDASGAPLEGYWTPSQEVALRKEASRWLKYWHDIDTGTPGTLPWCAEILEIDALETSEKLLSIISKQEKTKRSTISNASKLKIIYSESDNNLNLNSLCRSKK